MAAVGNYEVVSSTLTLSAGASTTIPAPSGKVILSVSGLELGAAITVSHPTSDGAGWVVTANPGGLGFTNRPYYLIAAEMGV